MNSNKRIGYIVVGAFIAAMLVSAMGALAILAGRTGPTQTYYALLDNVSDIKFGTQVRFEGFPIGQVEKIEPVQEGGQLLFRVEMSVIQDWRIPSDSRARIGSSGFLAAKTIDIDNGKSADPVPPGGRIASAAPLDLFATLASTATEFSKVNESHIKPLLKSLNTLANTVESDTPRITSEILAFVEQLNQSLIPIRRVLSNENAASAQRTIANLEESTSNLATTSRELSGTLDKVDSLITTLETLVASNRPDVERSLKDLRYTLDSVSRTIDSVVHNLDGTARNMNEFSRLIRTNPGLLLDGSPRPPAPDQTADKTIPPLAHERKIER